MRKYAIACGGTGGHLSPGIAIAEELASRGEESLLLISEKPVDKIMMEKYREFACSTLPAKPFSKNFKKFISFIKSQTISFFKCIKLLSHEKIDCVIGLGGFTNIPVVTAAFLLRKKIVLHESNKVIGKSIKALSCLADVIFLPHEIRFKNKFLQKKTLHAKMPLRREIRRIDKNVAREKFNLQKDGFVVTVLGGSQGANALTKWAEENFKTLNKKNIAVCCISGIKNKSPEIIVGKSEDGKDIINAFFPFCYDMPSLLSATDLLVCRAGAGTIAEASYLFVPMVLVPYPNAAENHQEANALFAKKQELATVIRQQDIELLGKIVLEFFEKDINNYVADRPLSRERTATEIIVDTIQTLTENV